MVYFCSDFFKPFFSNDIVCPYLYGGDDGDSRTNANINLNAYEKSIFTSYVYDGSNAHDGNKHCNCGV